MNEINLTTLDSPEDLVTFEPEYLVSDSHLRLSEARDKILKVTADGNHSRALGIALAYLSMLRSVETK